MSTCTSPSCVAFSPCRQHKDLKDPASSGSGLWRLDHKQKKREFQKKSWVVPVCGSLYMIGTNVPSNYITTVDAP